jgi:predicted nucleic acid-binding protein
MRIYLDTNVFVSLYKDEIGRDFRGLGIISRDFFERTKERNDIICISSIFLDETKNILFISKKQVFNELKNKKIDYELVKDTNFEEIKIFKNLGIHFPDYIHASIAYKNCDCIVTFNLKDFDSAKKFIPLFSPDDL